MGIWIGGDDARELADRIEKVLQDVAMSEDYGARLRAHAVEHLGWDAVARDTLDVYQSARERMTRRQKLTVAAGHPSAAETAKRA